MPTTLQKKHLFAKIKYYFKIQILAPLRARSSDPRRISKEFCPKQQYYPRSMTGRHSFVYFTFTLPNVSEARAPVAAQAAAAAPSCGLKGSLRVCGVVVVVEVVVQSGMPTSINQGSHSRLQHASKLFRKLTHITQLYLCRSNHFSLSLKASLLLDIFPVSKSTSICLGIFGLWLLHNSFLIFHTRVEHSKSLLLGLHTPPLIRPSP